MSGATVTVPFHHQLDPDLKMSDSMIRVRNLLQLTFRAGSLSIKLVVAPGPYPIRVGSVLESGIPRFRAGSGSTTLLLRPTGGSEGSG